MKTKKPKISKLTLALALTLFVLGANYKMKAQFGSGGFTINNYSNCSVDVFFEFQTPCGGTYWCCTPHYVVSLAAGGSATVPSSLAVPGDDALIRIYPYGFCTGTGCYYFGDFSTSPISGGCIPGSIPAGTSATGDDCNGTPNALSVIVNPTPGCNCMNIN